MVKTGSEDLTVGSDSEHTSFDSDQVEEFDSEEEFSRVLPTPSTKKQGGRVEEPESSPKARVVKERTLLEYFRTAKDAPNTQNTQHTQQTQQLPLLSGTQLRALMFDDASHEAEPSFEKTSLKDSRSLELDSVRNTIGDETDLRADEDEVINTDGIGIEGEEERILSSDDELPRGTGQVGDGDTNSGSKYSLDVTPIEIDVSAGTIESQGGVVKRQNPLKKAEYVDETPLKLLSMPALASPYVCVIVKWENDPNWWPARAEKPDWERREKRAAVLFRLNETGFVDLSTAAGEFELMSGAKVHLIGHGKRNIEYTVVETKQSNASPKVLTTFDGCNRVVLESHKSAKTTKSRSRSVVRSLEVDSSSVFFTSHDIEIWKAMRSGALQSAAPLTPERGKNVRVISSNQIQEKQGGKIIDELPDMSEQVSTSTPRKQRLSDGSPRRKPNGSLRDAIDEATTTPYTPRSHSRRGLQLSPTKTSFHHSATDNSIKSASPQVSPSKLAALRAFPLRASPEKIQGSPTLFSKAIFSISIGSSNRNKPRLAARLPDLILRHGGEVSEEGLSQKAKLSEMSEEEGCMPDIEHDFGDSTFCAVLADSPRRTLKYLEMLALGWPCLHYQYLLDCVYHDELLDWQPYLLPAGEISLEHRKMTVSQNTQAFHRRWLQGALLDEQFRKRRTVLRSTVPICVLLSNPALDDKRKRMLVTLSGPLYRVWFYEDKNSIPEGSLVLLLDSPGEPNETPDTDPELLYQIKTQAAADITLYKGLEWLVQCLINGELI